MLRTKSLIWMFDELDELFHFMVREDLGVGALIGDIFLEFLGQI